MARSKGFTLIEVIIAISILAFISIFTAQSIQNGIKSKVKIQNTIERDSIVRDALKVMANDINQAFNYRDINIELFNLAQDERKKRFEAKNKKKTPKEGEAPPAGEQPAPDPPTTTTADEQKKTKTFDKKNEVVLTQFTGRKDEIHFSSRSYSRSIQNSPFSDQAEIGYSLKTCRGRLNKDVSSQCLWRRVSPVIDDKIDEGGKDFVLLENVTNLKFRFLGPGTEGEWRQDWLSGEGGDAITKSKFPYAVEITLEVQNKNIEGDKPLAMTAVAAIPFANNIEKKGEGQGEATTSTAQ